MLIAISKVIMLILAFIGSLALGGIVFLFRYLKRERTGRMKGWWKELLGTIVASSFIYALLFLFAVAG